MKTEIIYPPEALSRHVKYFWTAEVTIVNGQSFSINTFVDDSSGIIFQQNRGKPSLIRNGNPIRDALIYGQTTIPTENACSASFNALGILFYPHAINELFGVPASQFTNQMIPLGDFLNKELVSQVMESATTNGQMELINNFLLKRVTSIHSEDKLVKHSLDKIKSSRGIIQVRDLCEFYNISERQFERRFHSVIGVSPRHYVKVARFHEAINLIRSGRYERFSEIAHALQYADQSHFIRHMKELSGVNSKNFQNRGYSGIVNVMSDSIGT
jgi:AraC-like DNA-binding protein